MESLERDRHQLSHSFVMPPLPSRQSLGGNEGLVLEELKGLVVRLAEALSEAQKPTLDEHSLWTAEQIAEHLDKSQRIVKESYVLHSTFPKAIWLPSTTDGRSRSRRWYALEVLEWVKSLREVPARGRPRQK